LNRAKRITATSGNVSRFIATIFIDSSPDGIRAIITPRSVTLYDKPRRPSSRGAPGGPTCWRSTIGLRPSPAWTVLGADARML
jgi:hypothetical protein